MSKVRIFFLSILSLAPLVATPASAAAAPARPNFLFIVTDDQGPWALGSSGNPNPVTPHLDRLRAEGAALTACYSPTPVCSPARVSLLTSRYGTELGITDYLPKGSKQSLDPVVPTWPRALAQAGYVTGLIGKYHCGETPQSHPTKVGYTEFSGFIRGGETSRDPLVEIDGKERVVQGWTSDILADLTDDFIRRHADKSFALSLHFWAPHANQHVNTEGDRTWLPLSEMDWDAVKDLDLQLPDPGYPGLDAARNRRMLREYLGSVHSVDRTVGQVLATLAALGLDRNTVIIFTSDHGFSLGQHGIWHKGNGRWLLTTERGSRPNMWDDSLRVPALIRWPGVVAPGSTVAATVSHLDWFPTLAAMAGASLPANVILRGQDISPLLCGEEPSRPQEFFAQYDMRGGTNMRSYQTPEWKLIQYLDGKLPDEFYDRRKDPQEKHNFHGSQDPVVVEAITRLEAKLRLSMAQITDPGTAQ